MCHWAEVPCHPRAIHFDQRCWKEPSGALLAIEAKSGRLETHTRARPVRTSPTMAADAQMCGE